MAITLRFGIGGILLRNIAGREESRADHSVGKKNGRKEDYNWQSFLSNKFLRVAVAPREVNEGASSRNTRCGSRSLKVKIEATTANITAPNWLLPLPLP